MISSCIRCSSRASSLLTYDHRGAEAYLDDATGTEENYEGLRLCATHAGRFVPPRGWSLIDRRTACALPYVAGEG
ncbi:MAG: DUF3499 family protein [Acidimicrobiia bacterium]